MLQCSDYSIGDKLFLTLNYHVPRSRNHDSESVYVIVKEVHCRGKTDLLEKIVVEQIIGFLFYINKQDDKWTKIERTLYAEELDGAMKGFHRF